MAICKKQHLSVSVCVCVCEQIFAKYNAIQFVCTRIHVCACENHKLHNCQIYFNKPFRFNKAYFNSPNIAGLHESIYLNTIVHKIAGNTCATTSMGNRYIHIEVLVT